MRSISGRVRFLKAGSGGLVEVGGGPAALVFLGVYLFEGAAPVAAASVVVRRSTRGSSRGACASVEECAAARGDYLGPVSYTNLTPPTNLRVLTLVGY